MHLTLLAALPQMMGKQSFVIALQQSIFNSHSDPILILYR